MIRITVLLSLCLVAASCGRVGDMFRRDSAEAPPPPVAEAPAEAEIAALDAPDVDAPAAAVPTSGRLGTTVASLGNPADRGLWLSTGLVSETRRGRVVYTASGESVELELRPSGGAAGAGSQVSLEALQALRAPITGLPELEVFAL